MPTHLRRPDEHTHPQTESCGIVTARVRDPPQQSLRRVTGYSTEKAIAWGHSPHTFASARWRCKPSSPRSSGLTEQPGHTRLGRLKHRPTDYQLTNVGTSEMVQNNESPETTPGATPSSQPRQPLIRSCPACKCSLKRMIQQQGATGGWISIAAHVNKCRLKHGRQLTGELSLRMDELQVLSSEQCALLSEAKALRKSEQPARRQAAQDAKQIPWFLAQKQQQQQQQAPKAPPVCCATCGAEFCAKDTTSFNQHSIKCVAKKQAQIEHHERVCEATARKAQAALQRVETLNRPLERAKAQLQAKQQQVEQDKRQKRALQGKKNKTVKKFAYHVQPEPEPEEQQCTLHGCLQRIKEAEKAVQEAQRRADFRRQTAEIAVAEREGVAHPLQKTRAAENQGKKAQKKLADFKKHKKRQSKEERADDRKCKSINKAKRRGGADHKYFCATVEF